MRDLLRTAYVRRITVQYLTVLLYDGNADRVRGGRRVEEDRFTVQSVQCSLQWLRIELGGDG